MRINPSFNYPNLNKNKTSFKAVPKASYKLFKNTGDTVLYQLNKSDIPFLKYFRQNLGIFFKKHNISDDSRREIIDKALEASVDFLNEEKGAQEKVKVLLAVSDKKPCGLLVGNGLKVDQRTGKYVYSSRKNRAKGETELDFLSTWDLNKRKGVGSALIDEYFRTVKQDEFNSVYVRSEVPQYSDAIDFYSRIGFKKISGNYQKLCLKKGDSNYLTGEYFDSKDLVAPMKATAGRINSTIASISKTMERNEEISHIDTDLFELFSINH